MATLTVVDVVIDNAGSGYATAPGVVVRDGTIFDPINPPTNFIAAKADRHPEHPGGRP